MKFLDIWKEADDLIDEEFQLNAPDQAQRLSGSLALSEDKRPEIYGEV